MAKMELGKIVPQMLGDLPPQLQAEFIERLKLNVTAAEKGALAALVGLNQLMSAQTANIQVTYRTYYSRVHILASVPNNLGLIDKPTYQFFSSGSSGNGQGAGFARQLGPDDTNVNTSSFLAANRSFIGLQMGIRFNPNMPLITQDTIANRSVCGQTRGNVEYGWGRVVDWPVGDLGIASQAASTTLANSTIVFGTNGLSGMKDLPSDGRVYLAPKQEVQITVKCQGSFYATTNGLPLGPNNALIPNNGSQGESAGYIECILRGYEIVQPG